MNIELKDLIREMNMPLDEIEHYYLKSEYKISEALTGTKEQQYALSNLILDSMLPSTKKVVVARINSKNESALTRFLIKIGVTK